MYDLVMDNLAVVFAVLFGLCTAASAFTKWTKTPTDDLWYARFYKCIEWLAMVTGHAKEFPGSNTTPSSGTGKTLLITLFAIGLGLQSVALSGCAAKVIADLDPRDQAVATVDLLIDQYTDAYNAYKAIVPSLSLEKQAQCKESVAPAMNIAKRLIKLASDAAIVWKLTDPDSEDDAIKGDAYTAAIAEAQAAIKDAISLYETIRKVGENNGTD